MLISQFQVATNVPIPNPEVETPSAVARILARDLDSEGREDS